MAKTGLNEEALKAATEAIAPSLPAAWDRSGDRAIAFNALDAACDARLGPNRLVRIGDVTDAIRRLAWEETIGRHVIGAVADHVERKFTEDERLVAKPPLGMVIYMPTHNHHEQITCRQGCPVFDWDAHVKRWGNPYPKEA